MRVAVVGAGTMGIGIAHAFATCDSQVWVVDPVSEQLERARRTLHDVLERGVARGRMSAEQAAQANANVTTVADVSDVPIGVDLAVEAVPELPELKHTVLAALEAREPRLIGSNTSSLPIGGLATALQRPDRFIGTHFFNPVWAMKLVELVVAEQTAPATVSAMRQTMQSIGKETIEVRDVPGFATSRLGIALGLEAIRMLESGVAAAEDIDKALVLGYGHPMGPLRLTDLVGLDVRLAVARYLQTEYGDRFAPPETLVRLVEEGHLGQKTGRGFYDWSEQAVKTSGR
jgi:3-hydroxybutyryl-CoA dehydrogenase